MPEVAVALAVVMILKRHGSTGITMAGVIEARRMRWYSISRMLRIHPEGAATVTNGGRTDVQGQGRLAKEGSGGAAEAGTWDDRGGPQKATVTVTDFVTDGAKPKLASSCALTDRFRSVSASSPHLTVDTLIWECGVVLPYRTTLFRVRRFCAI